MKKAISLNIIREANKTVIGTSNYNKYYMMKESKIGSKWNYIGWYLPHEETATIKQFKNNIYLMTNEETRYTLTDRVKELLNL